MARLLILVTFSCLAGAAASHSTQAQENPSAAISQDATAGSGEPILIWPGVAPSSENWTQKEVASRGATETTIRNVTIPTLTAFLPDQSTATGAAIIICPGGGFRFLSWENEGTKVAEWLQKRGVAAFVLKYRLKETPARDTVYAVEMLKFMSTLVKFRDRDMSSEAAQWLAEDLRVCGAAGIADGQQAVKVIRRDANKWNLKPDRIGIMGFSAGAIITSATCTANDPECRPDFAAHIYGPVFGEVKVPDGAPPLFILCTGDDAIAEASSVRLYSAWRDAGRDAELHIFEKGGHGFGMVKKNRPVDGWIDRFGDWLKQRNFIRP